MRALDAAFLLVLVACGGSSGDENRNGAESTATVARQVDSVKVTLVATGAATVGTAVAFVVTVRNESARAVDLYLRGRETTFDVIVQDSAGGEVWRLLHDAIVPAIIRLEHLAPNQALDLRYTWNLRSNSGQPATAGRYTAVARILTDGAALESAPVPFIIRP
jgi:intracellular proteinase inhibitor BsuPI